MEVPFPKYAFKKLDCFWTFMSIHFTGYYKCIEDTSYVSLFSIFVTDVL